MTWGRRDGCDQAGYCLGRKDGMNSEDQWKVRRVSREGNASADTFSAGQIGENRFCMFEQKPEVSKLLSVLGVTTEEQEELH